jgi:hypothetical protein
MELSMTKVEFSNKDVDRMLEKGQRFLRTISRKPQIAVLMATFGYTEQDHQEGWRLYLKVMGAPEGEALLETYDTAAEQKQAIVYLDLWDEPHFARAKAALKHRFSDQYWYVFHNLEASEGVAAVAAVNTYITRIQALRDGTDPDRAPHRKTDTAAVKLLESRRLAGTELEKELQGWISKAQGFQLPAEPSKHLQAQEELLQKNAAAFQIWLNDWRETARAGIRRRDYLIQLGLAKKRSKKNKAVEEVES